MAGEDDRAQWVRLRHSVEAMPDVPFTEELARRLMCELSNVPGFVLSDTDPWAGVAYLHPGTPADKQASFTARGGSLRSFLLQTIDGVLLALSETPHIPS